MNQPGLGIGQPFAGFCNRLNLRVDISKHGVQIHQFFNSKVGPLLIITERFDPFGCSGQFSEKIIERYFEIFQPGFQLLHLLKILINSHCGVIENVLLFLQTGILILDGSFQLIQLPQPRLHFHNNIIALILPILINVTYLLILKSYMAGIPEALYESARLDGAGDFTIYRRVAMPLCKAGLATVGLFIALNYWNDWYDAMLFLDEGRSDLYPLQYFLNNILTKAQAISAAAARSGLPMSEVPSEPMKLAMTVVATGPIILLYPFLQKYFVKGVTIGAVKG